MASRTFLDTNVLVYLFDRDEPAKQERARGVLDGVRRAGEAVVSTQVLQEFYVTVTRKLAHPLPAQQAESVVRDLLELEVVRVDPELILAAAGMSRKDTISFWDALILVAASVAGCARVLSEDLQHGRTLGRLRIENPFAA